MKSTDPGRPAKSTLIPRMIKMKIADRVRRFKIATGVQKQLEVLPEDWAIPDSALATNAAALAYKLSSPMLFAHVHRTYCFAAVLAARNGMKFDRELVYVASVLHDLGLTDSLANEAGSFEWVGARHARKFCSDERLSSDKCDQVHDAVALHSSVHLAPKREPEVALVHYGAALDLLGLRLDEIPKPDLEKILELYDRTDFKCAFGKCLQRQADFKPQSHIAGSVDIGFLKRIRETIDY